MADEGKVESETVLDVAATERIIEKTVEVSSKDSEEEQGLEQWLNKIMKIRISDGRTLIGSFLCTDKDRNIILGSCQEYVDYGGTEKEDPRILGLAMIPGKHIVSIDIDIDHDTFQLYPVTHLYQLTRRLNLLQEGSEF